MAKRAATDQERTPNNNATTLRRVRTFGTLTVVGGATLAVGATLVDLGVFAELPALASLGNALSAGAGLGLLFLPVGLRASRVGGRGYSQTRARHAWRSASSSHPSRMCRRSWIRRISRRAACWVRLVLLSVGFLVWFVAIRRAGVLGGWRRHIFLVAGLWFFLTFPTIQLPLFVIPNGTPSFVLLAGAFGILQLLMGMVVREQASRYAAPSQ